MIATFDQLCKNMLLLYFAYLWHLMGLIKSSMANSVGGVIGWSSEQGKEVGGGIWAQGKNEKQVSGRHQGADRQTEKAGKKDIDNEREVEKS